jgi:hypothetical protein
VGLALGEFIARKGNEVGAGLTTLATVFGAGQSSP